MTIISARNLSKSYGPVTALSNVSMDVDAGRITCVLGDNGAGKSTLIKILSGVHKPTSGEFMIDGEPVSFDGPLGALDAGVATVYQDLAVVPLMPVWRNFFLGSELTLGWGPFRRLDVQRMKDITRTELSAMGIDLHSVDQPIGTLSGGQRQCVAVARSVYFGARVLILDEPTAALGVRQSSVVLRFIAAARDRGLGVVFITHNPHHAYHLGDEFLLLKTGESLGTYDKKDMTLEELTRLMAGGDELEDLARTLTRPA